MLLRSGRRLLEIALFVLALGLGVAAVLGRASEEDANTLFFAAWCAALLLLFSLGLRLPSHWRGRLFPMAEGGVVLAVAVLAVLANVGLYRHDVHFDVTVTGRYTAPAELETVARSLKRDVLLSYFYNSQDESARAAKAVLAELARRRPHLRVRVLDLDKELVAARDYGVRIYNTAVIEADGRRTQLESTADLRQMAYAIERVLKERTQAVCFITGHGEVFDSGHVHMSHVEIMHQDAPGSSDVLEAPPYGIDRLKLAIETIGYSDRAIETGTMAAIPQDCDVVADLGPHRGYAPAEISLLKDYLSRGGRVLLMYDPQFPVAPDLNAMLGEVGVAVGSGVVVDPLNHYGADQEKAAVPYYPPHPITEEVALTVFPGARPLRLQGHVAGVTAKELIATSKDSYVRPFDATAPTSAKADAEEGRGPRTLAVAVDGKWPGSTAGPFRLVVVGSASFAANAFFPYVSNGDLAVSMIRWLADDNATPKLKPASYSVPEIVLTHTQMQVTFVVIVILLPLTVMLFGAAVWWRRR